MNYQLANKKTIRPNRGIYVYDENNTQFLDASAGYWGINIGFGRTDIVEIASKQMSQLSYITPDFVAAEKPLKALKDKIASIAPKHMSQTVFSESEFDTVDLVMKMVFRYWRLKNKVTKQKFINLIPNDNSPLYHHRQLTSATVINMDTPNWQQNTQYVTKTAYEKNYLTQIKAKIADIGADNIAGLITAPINGQSGFTALTKNFWQELQTLLNKNQILIIIDETMTAFGRTGDWFACQTFSIDPDFIIVGKNLSSGYAPISATIINDEITKALLANDNYFTAHFNNTEHSVFAAVSLKNLELLDFEGVMQQVKNTTAAFLQQQWSALNFHPLVKEADGIGMITTLVFNEKVMPEQLNFNNIANMFQEFAEKNGIVVKTCQNTIVVAPPLIITKSEIATLIKIIIKTLEQLNQHLKLT